MTDDASSATPDSTGSPSGYEFDETQNKLISELAAAMVWVAVPLMIVGVLYGVSAIAHITWAYRNWHTLFPILLVGLAALLYFLLGKWTKRSSGLVFRHRHVGGERHRASDDGPGQPPQEILAVELLCKTVPRHDCHRLACDSNHVVDGDFQVTPGYEAGRVIGSDQREGPDRCASLLSWIPGPQSIRANRRPLR